MSGKLHERARRIHERALVRSWEWRQRNFSKGTWFRLRRFLADVEQAWTIDESDADLLESRGRIPLPVGKELVPAKRLFLLTEQEVRSLAHARPIPVRMCAEFLMARSLAFIALRSNDGQRGYEQARGA